MEVLSGIVCLLAGIAIWFFLGPVAFVIILLQASGVAYAALRKGRDPVKWFTYGVLLPLIAIIHVSCIRTDYDAYLRLRGLKLCPYCQSEIPDDATVCRYCTREIGQRKG